MPSRGSRALHVGALPPQRTAGMVWPGTGCRVVNAGSEPLIFVLRAGPPRRDLSLSGRQVSGFKGGRGRRLRRQAVKPTGQTECSRSSAGRALRGILPC